MLQYGDASKPFKKSFPSIGLKEMFYDPIKDTIVQNPLSVQLQWLSVNYQRTSYRLTVRTLDFHSKDVGSIPASLNINSLNKLQKLNLLKTSNNSVKSYKACDKISYGFISLFNPSSIKNLTLYQRNAIKSNISSKIRGSFRNYKILVKQSYLMSA